MIRRRSLAASVAGAALIAAGSATAAPHATPKLKGTVGPGYTITLKSNAKAVKSVNAGTYSFVIADEASIHDFVLEQAKGGKFEKELPGIPFTGIKTVTVKLTPGEWEFYCRPHESSMHGDFTVK